MPRQMIRPPSEAYAALGLRFARILLGDELFDRVKYDGELLVISFLKSFNFTSKVAVPIHQSP